MIIKRNALLYLIILVVVFNGCDNSNVLLPEDQSLAIETIANGQSLGGRDEIPIRVRADRLSALPDTIEVSLYNSEEEPVQSYVFDEEEPFFPQLPDIVLSDLELSEDIYSLKVELFQEEEVLGVHDSWFFYVDNSIRLKHVTVNPHSVRVGEFVEVVVALQGQAELPPYAQFTMNGEPVYQVEVARNRIQFGLQAPDEPGVYDLNLDIYPWFDDRITETMASSSRYNIELLVLNEPVASENNEEHRIPASEDVNIDENLLYYSDEKLFFTVSMEELPGVFSEGRVFAIGDGDFMLALSRDESALGFRMLRGNTQYAYDIEIPINNILQEISITLFESEGHLTMLIFQGERLLYGDIIPHDRFLEQETRSRIITGVRTYDFSLGDIIISPIQGQQESAFRQILKNRHGNFVLYAEGFEFPLLIDDAIEYPEDAYVEQGYLLIPPGAWVQLPPFALDEYMVNVETLFHRYDDLSSLSISFFQQDGDSQQELFVLSGKGELKVGGESRELLLDTVFSLALNREDDLVTLNIQDTAIQLPVRQRGFFRLHLSQDYDAEVPVRIDSVSATNEAEELVDRVLDTLP